MIKKGAIVMKRGTHFCRIFYFIFFLCIKNRANHTNLNYFESIGTFACVYKTRVFSAVSSMLFVQKDLKNSIGSTNFRKILPEEQVSFASFKAVFKFDTNDLAWSGFGSFSKIAAAASSVNCPVSVVYLKNFIILLSNSQIFKHGAEIVRSLSRI